MFLQLLMQPLLLFLMDAVSLIGVDVGIQMQ